MWEEKKSKRRDRYVQRSGSYEKRIGTIENYINQLPTMW